MNFLVFTGNGKRSWTAPLPEVDKRDDDVGRTLLRNVLLNRLDNYPPQGGYYSDSESFNPIGSDSTEEELPYNREQQLRQLIKEQVSNQSEPVLYVKKK